MVSQWIFVGFYTLAYYNSELRQIIKYSGISISFILYLVLFIFAKDE